MEGNPYRLLPSLNGERLQGKFLAILCYFTAIGEVKMTVIVLWQEYLLSDCEICSVSIYGIV